MTKVTNTAEGARGVILKDGTTRFLEPNESADLELHPDHELYEGVKRSGAKQAAEEDEPKALSAMNKGELLDVAKAEGVSVADDATKADIADAIEKARAAQ